MRKNAADLTIAEHTEIALGQKGLVGSQPGQVMALLKTANSVPVEGHQWNDPMAKLDPIDAESVWMAARITAVEYLDASGVHGTDHARAALAAYSPLPNLTGKYFVDSPRADAPKLPAESRNDLPATGIELGWT